MKKSILAIGSCLVLFASCKETDPILKPGIISTDSTYVVIGATAQQHNVLVEEFTGEACPNCPAAHADLEAQSSIYPNRLNIIAYYYYGGPQTVPDNGSKYDLRDSTATNISNSIFPGIGGLPSGGIDRISDGGTIALFEPSWNADIASQMGISDSLNLTVSSDYNTIGGVTIATITATVTYTQPVTSLQSLSIALVEDSIYDYQEDNNAASGIDSSYLFLDVFRGMVTPTSGDQILKDSTSKEIGRTEKRIYVYTIPSIIPIGKSPSIVPAHCRVVAFVTETADNKPVLQSAQCPLKP